MQLGLSVLDPGCGYTGYGTTQSLLYLMGGWMFNGGVSNTGNPQLNTVFDSGAIAGFTGQQYPNGNFDCARCHATGYNFVTAGNTTGSAITGAHEVAGPEPTIQTSTAGGGSYGGGTYSALSDTQMSRWPTDQTSGDSSWYLTGVQCERCHIAEASYKTTGGVLEIVNTKVSVPVLLASRSPVACPPTSGRPRYAWSVTGRKPSAPFPTP